MDHLLAYLPEDRRAALANGSDLPPHLDGTALFADLASFTALTETLATTLGTRRGVDTLAATLNRLYDQVLQPVAAHGGSVLSFAGDAVMCWFTNDTGLTATSCAIAMQQCLATLTATEGLPSLSLKIGLARGAIQRTIVGDAAIQVIDVATGAPLDTAAALLSLAHPGEIVLDAAIARHLLAAVPRTQCTDSSGVTGWVISAPLPQLATPALPWPALPTTTPAALDLHPWVLPVVGERLMAGTDAFLPELRPAVCLFVRFPSLSPADVAVQLDPFLRWAQRTIHTAGGALLQVISGDKGNYFYAAFGAPIAHDDDPFRAICAAHDLRTPPIELAFMSGLQCGISQGMLWAGPYGGTTRRTYGVLGDAVNVAARLMQAAAPDQILVTENVAAAARPCVAWGGSRLLDAKGKHAPIAAEEVLYPRPSIIVAQPLEADLPLIGRDALLAQADVILNVVQQGQSQVMTLVGAAGMGKSHLARVIISQAQAAGLQVISAAGHEEQQTHPYSLWRPVVMALFGLSPLQSAEAQLAQLTAQVEHHPDRSRLALALFARLLQLPVPDAAEAALTPQQQQQILPALLSSALRAAAGRQPLLLVLDDLQWSDGDSRQLLSHLIAACEDTSIGLLLISRPPATAVVALQVEHRDSQWTTLVLEGLDVAATAAFATAYGATLGRTSATEQLVPRMHTLTQGHPLYLHEVLRYAHQHTPAGVPLAIPDLDALPERLEQLILSRSDRLSTPAQRLIKIASVVGRTFSAAHLAAAYPELGDSSQLLATLDHLVQAEILHRMPALESDTYTFTHSLIQEVIYQGLPQQIQERLHEASAMLLEQTADPDDAQAAYRIAHHYGQTRNTAKQAVVLTRAGRHAQAAVAFATAKDYYERALPHIADPSTRIGVLLDLGECLTAIGLLDRSQSILTEALGGLPSHGTPAQYGRCLQLLGQCAIDAGMFYPALEWYQRASDHARQHALIREQVMALNGLGLCFWKLHRAVEARAGLDQALQLLAAHADPAAEAELAHTYASLLISEEQYVAAQGWAERAARIADQHGLPIWRIWATSTLGYGAQLQGDLAAARVGYTRSLTDAQAIGYLVGEGYAHAYLGWLALCEEAYAAAEAAYRACLAIARQLENRDLLGYICTGQAVIMWRTQQNPVSITGLMSAATRLQHLREDDAVPSPAERIPILTHAATTLGEAAFAAAWRQGWALAWDAIISMVQEGWHH